MMFAVHRTSWLDWAGQDRAAVGCGGLCCAVLCWAGLGWAGLGWGGLGWAGLGWAGLGLGLAESWSGLG